jgi:inner membrane protease subunit 2
MRPAILHLLWRTRYYSLIGLFWGTTVPIFINDNIFEVKYIIGRSMAPTLSPTYQETGRRDAVLWNKWVMPGQLQRGDVVHFMNPLRPEAFAVKRVIGLEGDVVVLDRRRRPKAREGPEPAAASAWDAWKGRAKVPQGHVWVEGDNERESLDSNWYGPISKSLVTGRASAIVWPPSRFWTKPWLGFSGRTRVIKGRVETDWTEGLPVGLEEIGEPHLR